MSFDSLAEEEQKMFLGAATVYCGHKLKNVLRFWKGCGWAASSGWENLLDRCLVTMGKDGFFDMHEVLRDLGRSIACPDPDNITFQTRISGAKNVKALCEVLSARRQQGQVSTALLISRCSSYWYSGSSPPARCSLVFEQGASLTVIAFLAVGEARLQRRHHYHYLGDFLHVFNNQP